MILEIITFIAACFVLAWLSSYLVKNLISVAQYLRMREFIVAFFVLGFAASLPNLFVDVNAALHNMPQIALGDMIGGNLVDLTLVMAVAVFFCRGFISTESKMVRGSAIFTSLIAVFPLLLLAKGSVTRWDGVILILTFCAYVFWLFSEDERFKKIYKTNRKQIKNSSCLVVSLIKIGVILVVLLLASQVIIKNANFFAQRLGTSLTFVAILIVGLGNCFPETYFSIISARKEQNWMVLGDLMASVMVCATLVFGIVAIISPFKIADTSHLLIARIFLVLASIFFLVVTLTGKKITKKEGLFLLFLYIAFLIAEIFIK